MTTVAADQNCDQDGGAAAERTRGTPAAQTGAGLPPSLTPTLTLTLTLTLTKVRRQLKGGGLPIMVDGGFQLTDLDVMIRHQAALLESGRLAPPSPPRHPHPHPALTLTLTLTPTHTRH